MTRTYFSFDAAPQPHVEHADRGISYTRRVGGRGSGRKRSRKCVPQLSRKTYIRGRRYTFTTLTRAPLSSPPPTPFEFVAPEIYYIILYYNAPQPPPAIRREYYIIIMSSSYTTAGNNNNNLIWVPTLRHGDNEDIIIRIIIL